MEAYRSANRPRNPIAPLAIRLPTVAAGG
jgi:hypothetical protein